MTRTNASPKGIVRREVAFVIAAIAMLLAIAIPYVYRQRTLQRRQVCETRQFRASLALIQYSLDHQHLPGYRNLLATDHSGTNQPASWIFPILPYLHPIDTPLMTTIDESYTGPPVDSSWEYKTKYDRLIGSQGPWAPIHHRYGPAGESSEKGNLPNLYIPELICPDDSPLMSDQKDSYNSLVANCGMPDTQATANFPADWLANGVFTDQFPGEFMHSPRTRLENLEELDGLSNIVMISENVDAGMWTDSGEAKVGFVWTTTHSSAPAELVKDIWRINEKAGQGTGTIQSARPSSFHLNGVNVAMCDGSTRFIRRDIDELAWGWMLMSDSTNPKYPGTNQLIGTPVARDYRPIRSGTPPRNEDEGSQDDDDADTADDSDKEDDDASTDRTNSDKD